METVDHYHEDASSRLVEGVSNEVTSAFVTLIVLVASLSFYWHTSKRRRQTAASTVHPSMEPAMNEFRELFIRSSASVPDEESIRRLAAARARNDRECPICFGVASFGVLTNCGHVFCCECIIGYWNHAAGPLTPVPCAVCRTPVTVLLPLEWPASIEDDEHHENNIRLNSYNRKFSGERPWLDVIWDIPVLVPYLLNNLTTYSGLLAVFRARALLCLLGLVLYMLWPFDVLPEGVYGLLGLADDLCVLGLALLYLCIALRECMARRGEAPLED